ncbi:MAG: hypothetical protein HEQ33_12230 [Dolichospermum sp. WA123]|nr:hypothetical protein [Dolichospermum sp. WA123]
MSVVGWKYLFLAFPAPLQPTLCPISSIIGGICDFIKVKLNLIKIKKSLF